MKLINRKRFVAVGFVSLIGVLCVCPCVLRAQPPWAWSSPPVGAIPTTPQAQRNALNKVRSRVNWLQNTTRTAANFNDNVGKIWREMQSLRAAYNAFTMTLNPQQRANGANELAELSAGLDILESAFTNYNNDVAGGRSENAAFAELSQVMRQGARFWQQELDRVSARLLVGRNAGIP
jgi:hypothetical protein